MKFPSNNKTYMNLNKGYDDTTEEVCKPSYESIKTCIVKRNKLNILTTKQCSACLAMR